MSVRRVVAGLGRTMISAGVLILLFVVYQLWGTGLAEARSQRDLKRQFEDLLAAEPTTTTTTLPPTTVTGVPSTTLPPSTLPAGPPPAPQGDAVAIIRIPKIGVEKAVVQGVTLNLLKKGPGHYPTTPMPGQPGNAAIAGHRTTYGAPFFRINELGVGDPILITTRQGKFRYEVSSKKVVAPNDNSVLLNSEDNRLTITTCEPRFSAAKRLIVVALLKGEAAEPPPPPPTTTTVPPVTTPGAPSTAAPPTTTTTTPSLEDLESLSGDGAGNGPAILWGLLAATVWFLTWLAGRQWKRWPAYLLGTPVFFVVLFVFFENFSRLLPANY